MLFVHHGVGCAIVEKVRRVERSDEVAVAVYHHVVVTHAEFPERALDDLLLDPSRNVGRKIDDVLITDQRVSNGTEFRLKQGHIGGWNGDEKRNVVCVISIDRIE